MTNSHMCLTLGERTSLTGATSKVPGGRKVACGYKQHTTEITTS